MPDTTATQPLGVAVVGFGWMGQVHARAYARLPHHYPHLPLLPTLVTVSDSEPDRRADARARFGFLDDTADWRAAVQDDRVQVVSVTAPNFLHREIGCAVADAGKHLWIEKPVGLTADDTRAVSDAVARAGVQSAVGFNYRNAPAVEHARDLVTDGALGRITSIEVHLNADYAAHPQGALSWRFQREFGGSGVLGDLTSHGIDLARYLVGGVSGEITELVADTATSSRAGRCPRRPTATTRSSRAARSVTSRTRTTSPAWSRFADGTRGSITSSRVSVGDQCTYGATVRGTKGYVSWDFRRPGELVVSAGDTYLDQAASTLFVGPRHGELGAFQPGGGIAMGYDDLKVIEAMRLVTSIAEGKPRGATVADAVAMAEVVDAMVESAAERRWVPVRT